MAPVDRHQLELAIEAQEQLRGSVPDDVIDATIATLRERLAGADPEPSDRRRQATVLFADVAGFTALASGLDAEVIGTLMNELWAEVDRVIDHHGGWLDKHIGDAVMAVWGAEHSREDDPERAVRAALELITTFAGFRDARSLDLDIRIGVNTGPLVVGAVGIGGEVTAMGDTVNVASRLEHAAAPGSVLISHDTYRHVRGIFDAEGPELITVKGKSEPIATYRVHRPKPRRFRVATRGVEGVETRMIGRDAELAALQRAYDDTMQHRRAQLVTVVGDAGTGKSRLLYELVNWIELRPEAVFYFKGRAGPDLEAVPRGLLRELFAYRFDINDNDPRSTVREKLHDGFDPLDDRAADVLGQWLGFDLTVSDAVQDLSGSPEFGAIAEAHLARYLGALMDDAPIVVLLEDIHWSDPESLDAIEHLLDNRPDVPALVVAVTRPTLLDARPSWSERVPGAIRIDIEPLPSADCRALVEEILQRIDHLPGSLVDLVVDRSEGNPFFVEELVKVLIEQGVIATDADGSEWTVLVDRVEEVALPSTLNGIMQARVDNLPQVEHSTLQHASVVGRIFWDDAVTALVDDAPPTPERRATTRATFEGLCARGLVHGRARSVFAGSEEFVFHHALLRDTMYETVLLRDRERLHAATARWLEARSADRIDEHLGLIAEHLARGGEPGRAAELFERSAERSFLTGAIRSANGALERAVELRHTAGTGGDVAALAASNRLGETYRTLGQLRRSDEVLRDVLRDARRADAHAEAVRALNTLAAIAIDRGDFDEAGDLIDEALRSSEPDGALTARALLNRAEVLQREGKPTEAKDSAEEALTRAQTVDEPLIIFAALNTLASLLRDDLDESERYLNLALVLARGIGNLEREALVLSNLGVIAHIRAESDDRERNYASAIEHYRRSCELYSELGLHEGAAQVLVNLAQAEIEVGDRDGALRDAIDALARSTRAGADSLVLFVLLVCAQIAITDGDVARGLGLIGLVRAHPRRSHNDLEEIDRILGIYRDATSLGITDDEVESALAAGARLDPDDVVAGLLARRP